MADQDESGFPKTWRWWKIAWTVIRNLLYIFVVVLVFDRASSTFENLVLCLLILIYEGVSWAHTTQLRVTVEEGFVNRRMLLTLHKAAGEDISEATEIVNEAQNNYNGNNARYYINIAGATIVYLIVVWKLLATLLF